jgi:predicted PurR-regulated permease PerM
MARGDDLREDLRDDAPLRPDWTARRGFELAAIVLGSAAALFLIWQAAESLLVVFGGILFGVFLDACARGLALVLPIGRRWCLGIVCLALAAALAFAGWAVYALAQDFDSLVRMLREQLRTLADHLGALGIRPDGEDNPGATNSERLVRSFLPDPAGMFGGARVAFNAALGILGNAVVIAFVGIFAAASPDTYRRALVSVVPRDKRRRFGEVLDEMASALRWWLVGQLVAMILIGISVALALALLGLPGAILLGVQAGLLSFIPYLGPVLGGIPIALASLPHGLSMLLWVLGVYMVIQSIEGYLLTPMIQRRAVHLPPVITLAALMVMGALFGIAGVALATPLVAAGRVAVIRLYLEDALGDPA